MGKFRLRKAYSITPVVEFCVNCKKNRVTDHHVLCNVCWGKKQNGKEKIQKTR